MREFYLIIIFFLIGYTSDSQDLFSSNAVVTEMRLEFYDSNWASLLENNKLSGEEERIPAKLTVNGMVYDSVGVRYKGNSSFYNVKKSGSSKLPFNIKTNYFKKGQCLPNGYKSIKLSNVFRDPSFVREVLSYEIANEFMPSSRSGYVKLIVNGANHGLYNITESVDKEFIKRHYGYKKGTLIKCDPNWKIKAKEGCALGDKASLNYLGEDIDCYKNLYELKGKKGWEHLVNLANILENHPDKIESQINVDQVLWMHAFNNVLVNLDSYVGRLCHNYYLFRDSFGIFQPIVWDMNLSFGGFRFDGAKKTSLTDVELQELSMFLHYKSDNPNRPLITNLLKNGLYRKIYVAHIKTMLRTFFTNEKYKKRAKAYQTAVKPYVTMDQNKLYSQESFDQNYSQTVEAGSSKIIGITELMDPRIQYLSNHPLIKKEDPSIENVRAANIDQKVIFSAKVTGAKNVWVFYREVPGAPFLKAKMKDDGLNEDLDENDSTFGLILNDQIVKEYYIVAEGDKTASLSPEKAAFEFHTIPGSRSIHE